MAIKFKTHAPAEPSIVVGLDPCTPDGDTSVGTLVIDGKIVGQVTDVKFTPGGKAAVGGFLKQKLTEQAQSATSPQGVIEKADEAIAQLSKTPAPMVQVSDSITAQVEELVDLDERMRKAGAYEMVKKIDELKKTLQSVASEMDPTMPAVFESPSGVVVFSENRHETKISNKPELIKLMGMETYLAASKITLTDAKKYLSEMELAKVTTTELGSRSLKSITQKS